MTATTVALEQFQAKIQALAEGPAPEPLPDQERVARAKAVFARRLDRSMAAALETCLHCGMCAEACHFYEATHQGKYAPVHKLEPLRRYYRREVGPFRWFHRLLSRDVSARQLEDWQELVYDACTDCGRCDLICPVGIRLSPMIAVVRAGLAAAGLMPAELRALNEEQRSRKTLFGVGVERLEEVVEALRADGLEVPLDREDALVLVLTSVTDLIVFTRSLAGIARILNRIGTDWTMRRDAFDASNFGALAGDEAGQRQVAQRIVRAAERYGIETVIVPECGHAYPVLRWQAANLLGQELPFEVVSIAEFLARELKAGRLRLKPAANGKSVTFHDPCKMGRLGGVIEQPRALLEALELPVKEMSSTGKTGYCCGGGGGVFVLNRAARLRQQAFEIKMHEADETGADVMVTSCDTCRYNLLSGAQKVNWNKPIESLVELVAENLA